MNDLLAFVRARHPRAGVPRVDVDGDVVTVRCARPGLLIGKQGVVALQLEAALCERLGRPVQLKLLELRQVELEPQLVADDIAQRLLRCLDDHQNPPPPRDDDDGWTPEPIDELAARCVKVAVERTARAGAVGVKVAVRVQQVDIVSDFGDVDGADHAGVDEGGVVVDVWIRARTKTDP